MNFETEIDEAAPLHNDEENAQETRERELVQSAFLLMSIISGATHSLVDGNLCYVGIALREARNVSALVFELAQQITNRNY